MNLHHLVIYHARHTILKKQASKNRLAFKIKYLKGQLIRDYLENCVNKKELFDKIGKQINLMHEKNIIHRDIKPENILVSSNADIPQIKLIDLGLAELVLGKTEHSIPYA